MYLAFKHAHMMFALASGVFFLLRGIWMLMDSPLLQKKWVKVLPHINDALLLACAIWLMFSLHQYPGTHHWLTAKVVALVVYIGFGMVALKRGKTKMIRSTAFLAALATYAYMLGVAMSKSPLSWFA